MRRPRSSAPDDGGCRVARGLRGRPSSSGDGLGGRHPRRLEHGLPDQRGRGRGVPEGQPGVRVTVGISGTGGGFQKFCRGETDISNASRPIKRQPRSRPAPRPASTSSSCRWPTTAWPSSCNPKATWVDRITVAELKTIWAPEAQDKVERWARCAPGWPDRELHLFGAGVDSGTYDYFTEAIVGKEGASRGDFTSSEDDNVLVQGIASDELALGFLPYAYYAENKAALSWCRSTTARPTTAPGRSRPASRPSKGGTYQPLSRPVFIYVSTEALDRPEVASFVDFYLAEGGALAEEVGYVPLGDRGYQLVAEHFKARKHRLGLRARRVAGRAHHRAAAGPRDASRARRMSTPPGRTPDREPAVPLRGALGRHDRRHHRGAGVRDGRRSSARCRCSSSSTGTEWTPLFADQALRRAAAGAGHAAGLGDRDGRGRADRAAERHLPERVRARQRAPRRQAGARDPGRRADGGLRLLRADLRHAAPAAVAARPGRLQRAQPGHRHGHHDPAAGQLAVGGRDAGRAERPARRPPTRWARRACRRRCRWSCRRRSRASPRRSSWPSRAPSARR